MGKKEPNKRYYEKERNRFMSLRYKSDTDDYPYITATELAKELDCSKATISTLEDPNLEKNTLPGINSRLIKAYHDKFGCPYEYLFGETNSRDPKYMGIDPNSPLSEFDSQTLNNLEQMLSNKEKYDFDLLYMLKALLANSEELHQILYILFQQMYKINETIEDTTLPRDFKEITISSHWFILNQNINKFLENTLLPKLQVAFRRHEEKLSEKQEKMDAAMKKDIEEYLNDTIVVTVQGNEKSVTKVEK